MSYKDDAKSDALEMIEHFSETIGEMLAEGGKVSDDINNDYPDGDSYHHETHVDKEYSPKEAVELLNELDEFEETDSGLWEGQEWDKVLSAMAAFTYGNAVMSYWREYIEELNESNEVEHFAELNHLDCKEALTKMAEGIVNEFVKGQR